MLTRCLRCLLSALLGLAVLSLVVVGILFFYVSPARVVAKINRVLADAVGMEIVLRDEDAASLKRLPKLAASLREGELRFTTGESAGTFSNISVALSPLSIFAEAPRIESISITGFRGRLSVDRFLSMKSVQAAGLSAGSEESADSAEKKNPPAAKEWDIAEFRMEDASAVFEDMNAEGAAAPLLRLENACVEAFSLSEKGGALNIAGTLLSERGAGEASFSSGLSLLEDGRLALNAPKLTFRGLANQTEAQAAVSAASVSASANGVAFDSLRFDAALSNKTVISARFPSLAVGAGGSISSARAAADISIPGSSSRIDLAVRGEIERQAAGTWRISNLALESRLARRGEAAKAASSMTGSFEASERERRASLRLSGMFIDSPADFDGTLSFADPERIPQAPRIAGRLALGRIDPALLAFVSADAAKAALRRTELDLTLSAADLGLIPDAAAALEGSLSAANGRISSSGMNVRIREGAATLKGALEADGRFSVSIKAEKMPAADLMRAAGLEPALSGLLSGAVELAGDAERAVIAAASGRVCIADGLLTGFDAPLAGSLLKREHFAEMPAEIANAQAQTHFDSLAFEIAPPDAGGEGSPGSGVRLVGLEMKGLGWSAAGSGVIDAAKIRSELTFAYPDEGLAAPLAVLLELDAKGAQWTPAWKEAASAIGKSPDQSTVERLLMRLRRLLINFWKSLDVEMPDFSDRLPDLSGFRWPWEDEVEKKGGAGMKPAEKSDPAGAVI